MPEASGKDAAREVLSPGIALVMTAAATFLCLNIVGAPVGDGLTRMIPLGALIGLIAVQVVLPGLVPQPPPSDGEQRGASDFTGLLTDPARAPARTAFILICGAAAAGAADVALHAGLHAGWLKWAGLSILGVFVILIFYFGSLLLPLMALTPVVLAAGATLGTFRLFDFPVDATVGLFLALAAGLAVHFPLFYIRSRMRYGMQAGPERTAAHEAMGVQAAALVAGFVVLVFTNDPAARRLGSVTPLVTTFSFVCAFAVLPLLMDRWAGRLLKDQAPGGAIPRVIRRYRIMEGYPRAFSRCKLRLDGMFRELPEILDPAMDVGVVIDIGCGYGIPGSWCLERYPRAQVHGIDPDRARVRVANRAWNGRGKAVAAGAPDAPAVPSPADLAFMLDMIHFITDDQLRQTLERLHAALDPGGLLVIRAVVPLKQGRSWMWYVERFNHHLFRITPHYRSVQTINALIRAAGFGPVKNAASGSAGELNWFIARASEKAGVAGA